ncbi:MAG: hypothetical protein JWQ87_100 [Candidatus Sulfotelmatobacter sp.]|nr:hypothetical protein [Candidatus Sulfotelmatobacter sp.]
MNDKHAPDLLFHSPAVLFVATPTIPLLPDHRTLDGLSRTASLVLGLVLPRPVENMVFSCRNRTPYEIGYSFEGVTHESSSSQPVLDPFVASSTGGDVTVARRRLHSATGCE